MDVVDRLVVPLLFWCGVLRCAGVYLYRVSGTLQDLFVNRVLWLRCFRACLRVTFMSFAEAYTRAKGRGQLAEQARHVLYMFGFAACIATAVTAITAIFLLFVVPHLPFRAPNTLLGAVCPYIIAHQLAYFMCFGPFFHPLLFLVGLWLIVFAAAIR